VPRSEYLKTQSSNAAWGIDIEEKPHWGLFTLVLLIFVLISAAVALVHALRTGDVQTGVTIGGTFIAVQILAIMLRFFWWLLNSKCCDGTLDILDLLLFASKYIGS
jgi:hypothetical protein